MSTADVGARSVVSRVVAILLSFAHAKGDLGISEISRETGLALSTTHRLVRELTRCGVLDQTPARRYALSPEVAALAVPAPRRSRPPAPQVRG